MQLSNNEIRNRRKKGHRGPCYWRLLVPCPDHPEDLKPLEGDSHDFGDFEVTKIGKCKFSKFEIKIKDETTDVHHKLTFMNSCDVRPEL